MCEPYATSSSIGQENWAPCLLYPNRFQHTDKNWSLLVPQDVDFAWVSICGEVGPLPGHRCYMWGHAPWGWAAWPPFVHVGTQGRWLPKPLGDVPPSSLDGKARRAGVPTKSMKEANLGNSERGSSLE